MNIKFLSSKEQEKEKLLNIYSDYQWFIDNDFPIILPEFYNQLYLRTKNNEKEFKKELSKELDKIYNKNVYLRQRDAIKNEWQKIEKEFFDIMKNLNFKIKKNYLCYISLYGPEGQFQYPDIINVRVSNNNDIKEANINIAHEIIHLIIFNKVQKMKLDYNQIEGIVDLFFTETKLKNLFPNYKLQSIAVHDKKLFEKII